MPGVGALLRWGAAGDTSVALLPFATAVRRPDRRGRAAGRASRRVRGQHDARLQSARHRATAVGDTGARTAYRRRRLCRDRPRSTPWLAVVAVLALELAALSRTRVRRPAPAAARRRGVCSRRGRRRADRVAAPGDAVLHDLCAAAVLAALGALGLYALCAGLRPARRCAAGRHRQPHAAVARRVRRRHRRDDSLGRRRARRRSAARRQAGRRDAGAGRALVAGACGRRQRRSCFAASTVRSSSTARTPTSSTSISAWITACIAAYSMSVSRASSPPPARTWWALRGPHGARWAGRRRSLSAGLE